MGVLRFAFVLLLAAAVGTGVSATACLAADEHAAADHGGDHHDAAGHGHEAHGEPNPLTVDPDLAIWTVLVFLILLGVLWKFAWGPISAALDQREQKISDNITAAEECNQEARRLLAEYEAKLTSAREEVRGILEEARRDAEHTGQEIVAKARADAGVEIERGKREIETATGQALNELAKTSANLAVDLAGRIVNAKLNEADHAKLIEDAIAKFPRNAHQHS